MDDMMIFPETVEEFMFKYKITDTEQIYTNGAELVPIFRMKQWFDHKPERKKGEWIRGDMWSEGCGMGESYGFYYRCSVCKKRVQGDYNDCGMNYCPNCGANMRGE